MTDTRIHPGIVERLLGFSKEELVEELMGALQRIAELSAAQSAAPVGEESDQDFVDMLWKWFEERGCDLRPERLHGLSADDFRIMLDEHEAALTAAPVGESEMMARLSASESACYRWPEDTAEHRAMRAAFMDGASHIALQDSK